MNLTLPLEVEIVQNTDPLTRFEVRVVYDVTDKNGRLWKNRTVGRGRDLGEAFAALGANAAFPKNLAVAIQLAAGARENAADAKKRKKG